MKRYFTYRDEKSDKFWVIETNEDEMVTFYGKSYDRASGMKRNPELCSVGTKTEKMFDTEAECAKEAEKAIAKKIKDGYSEQEEVFINLYNEIKYLHHHKEDSILPAVLAEMDKRDKPLRVNYGIADLVWSLFSAFYFRVECHGEVKFDAITDFTYRLPKLEGADEKTANDLVSLYGYGLRVAAIQNDEKLDSFIRSHVPAETTNSQLAIGLAYSAARWNRKDEIEKYVMIEINDREALYMGCRPKTEKFRLEEFFKPYLDILAECEKKRK
ncbi:hypothetical protein LQZ19_04990 [Treponema primitia]|uniref:WGR domain-containing protein n=1 Tax=Treponema primitia TaxID=88058 RepID=UPI00397FE166